ncbi:hypothetical protein [Streptosporangium saharense]|uniref:Uncharacterized protein n=1 Tax=Streptosporangium saharense TaxID=1706840 RepID=A0A7W7VSC0_9ACTN|nr:hypothetical protein [Streptosporangium saharense]MBB4920982.1 hypothetical protein [Streptosporangium saharense]
MTTRTGLLDGGPGAPGVTTKHLAGLIGAGSAKTGARRLAELEAAGLVEVTARRGGRLFIRPVFDPADALSQAARYARDGRHVEAPSPRAGHQAPADPGQNAAVDPGQDPAVDPGQNPAAEPPSGESPSGEPLSSPLAVGALVDVSGAGAAADAERREADDEGEGRALSRDEVRATQMVLAAVGVVAGAIPPELLAAMSQSDRGRLLRAVETELTQRTGDELRARIRRRLGHWRGRDVRRPVAVALTLVRRGYSCPRWDCEDHMLPSGHECGACATIGTAINEARRQAALNGSETSGQPFPGGSKPPHATPAPSGDLRAVPTCPLSGHQSAGRRADGECAACWSDRISAS